MPGFWYKVEVMPSASANLTSWLDNYGASKWQLVQVVPVSNITTSGSNTTTTTSGQVLCYFMSGSNT
jgi:hypothetical protein